MSERKHQSSTSLKLNRDKHHRYLEQGEYRWAKNALHSDHLPFISNDLSNKLCVELDGNLIGSVYISNNEFVLFTDSNSIIRFNSETCSTEYIITNLNCLEFDICNQITVVYRVDITCSDIYIYWIDDGLHNIRRLNITDSSFINELITSNDCSLLELQHCTEIAKFNNITVNDSGGVSIITGIYQFVVRIGIDNDYGNWFRPSQPISIIDDSTNGDFSNIDGAAAGTNTSKSIFIELSNLDGRYSQIQIAVIKTIANTRSVDLIITTNYSGTTFNYTYTGTNDGDIQLTLDDITSVTSQLLKPKILLTKDNRLIAGNFSSIRNINYQKYANNINVNYYTKRIKLDTLDKGYGNTVHNYLNRSWLRDEVYMLGIVWDLCDGTHTVTYPLIGRKPECRCKNPENNVPDFDGNIISCLNDDILLCDEDLIDENDPNKIDCDLERWKNYNTGYRTELNDCSINTIRLNFIETEVLTCVKTTTIPDDGTGIIPNELLSPVTTCLPDDSNNYCEVSVSVETEDIPGEPGDFLINIVNTTIWSRQIQYTELNVDLSTEGWILIEETSSYKKWFRCVITGTDSDPLCYDPPTIPCVYSRGQLAFQQSCEQYPIIKDCTGIPMYPHTIDNPELYPADGSFTMDFIRLHRMPCTRIEPHFSINGVQTPINPLIGQVEGSEAGEQISRPYEDIYIYVLGLEFTNIVPPDDIDPTLIKGYRIVYVERNENNKTVIAKGLLHGTFRDDSADSRLYTIPRHGVNSVEYFADTGGGGTTNYNTNGDYIPAYTFHSPDTDFITNGAPNVTSDYIKIEGQVFGKGRVYGDCEDFAASDLGLHCGRRQNINLNGFINDTHNNVVNQNRFDLEINRNIRGIQYAAGNNIVLNESGITYPLWNPWRESCVYLELNSIPNPNSTTDINNINPEILTLQHSHTDTSYQTSDPNQLDYYFDADDSFRKVNYQCADNALSSNEFNTDNNCLVVQEIPANTWYVSIKRNRCDLYTNVTLLEFIDTGLCNVDLTDLDLTAEKQQGTFGDTFINYWSYLRTSVPAFYDGEKYSSGAGGLDDGKPNDDHYSGVNFGPIVLKTLIHCVVESEINVKYRHEGNTVERQIYYPKLGNKSFFLDSSIPLNADPENSFLNGFYVSDKEPSIPEEWLDNYNEYNTDYSLNNLIRLYPSYGFNYNTCDCDTTYSTTIAYSNVQTIDQITDNWRTFLVNNYIPIPSNTGELIEISEFNNTLYAHTKDAIWKIFSNESQLQVNNDTVYLGSGDLFSQTPKRLYATNEGYGGTSLKRGILTNQYGHFWIDDYAGKIHMLTGEGIKNLSDKGLLNWFRDNIPFCLLKQFPNFKCVDNPANPDAIGIHTTFDNRYNRYIVTKKDYELNSQFIDSVVYDNVLNEFKINDVIISLTDSTYFCNKSWTIAFSFNVDGWISWYDYIPEFYLRTRKTYYSFNAKSNHGDIGLFEHNIKCDYQTYYNIQRSYELEFILNNKVNTSIWESIKWNSEVRDCVNSSETGLSKEWLRINGFTNVLIYNSNQASGWLNLVYDGGTWRRQVSYPNVIVDRNERYLMINDFRDYSINNGSILIEECGNCGCEINEVLNSIIIDPNKDYRQLQKFRDAWVAVRFRLEPQNQIQLTTDYLIFLTQNSIR